MTNIQNIYDNPDFFAGYSALRNNEQGFNAVLEQPTMRSLLPALKDLTILDIGCGFGDFCRYARSEDAANVVGIDVSERMLAVAKEKTQAANIEYQCIPIEKFIPAQTFDIIVSSVTFHYVEDYVALCKKLFSWLKPNGTLVFSVEHPICTAYSSGVHVTQTDIWPIKNYRDEEKILQTWFVEGVIKYHRTLQTYLNTLLEVGFTLQAVLEPMPTDAQIEQQSRFAIHKIRPPLLVVKVIKGKG